MPYIVEEAGNAYTGHDQSLDVPLEGKRDHLQHQALAGGGGRGGSYLIDGVEVLVVEVSEEPQHARSEHLAQQQHQRGQVEDEDHASQPVKEHHRACCSKGESVHRAGGWGGGVYLEHSAGWPACGSVWSQTLPKGGVVSEAAREGRKETHKGADVHPPAAHEREEAGLHS